MKMLVFQLLCSSLGRAILMITIYTSISVEQPHCILIYISALPIIYLSMTGLVSYNAVLHDVMSNQSSLVTDSISPLLVAVYHQY